MLLPRKVEEIVIAVPRHLYDLAVAATAEAGVLHVASPPEVEGAEYERKYRTFLARVSEKVSRLETFFKAAGEEPRTVRGVTIEAGSWEEAYQRFTESFRSLEERLDHAVSRLQEIETKLSELQALKAVLEPVAHIESDIRQAYSATAFVGYSIGYIRVDKPEQLDTILRTLAAKHGVIIAAEMVAEKQAAVAMAGSPKALASIMHDIRRFGWTPISIPEDLPGSPKEAYEKIKETTKTLIEDHDKIVKGIKEELDELAKYYTAMVTIKHAAEILANTSKTRTLAMFRGFIDRADRTKLEKKLREALGGAYLIVVLGVRKAKEYVPTKVDLPRPLRPFHEIVRMYGEPEPDEVVPTVFLAITMPLIFGLMFPDMGHGLLVLLFAVYILSKDNVWRAPLIVMSSFSLVTGFLAGEFFGPVVSEKIGLYHFWESLGFEAPPLAQPTFAAELTGISPEVRAELTRILLFRIISISLWLAAFMLSFGTLLGFIDALLKKDREGAFASKLPTFIFFASATAPFLLVPDAVKAGGIIKEALFTMGHGGPLQAVVWYGTITGLLWKLLGEPIAYAIEHENPLKAFGSSFMETYEMLAMVLGNVPSFLRILGLGLAHAGLMLGFAKLYHIMAHAGILGLIGGILTYILGNLLVAALEAIIALAHSLRLHFYEWFSKFYSGRGIPFTPVRIEGVRIVLTPSSSSV